MTAERQAALKPAAAGLVARPYLGILQRQCACGGSGGASGQCEDCKEKEASLQRRAQGSGAAPGAAPPIVREVLRSPGRPLDASARAYMEPRFGHDFGKVRVHADPQGAESARAVNALAYTVGHHLVFGAGQYRPSDPGGRRLLAHELAHVVQQSGSLETYSEPLPVSTAGEAEAESAAQNVMASRHAGVSAGAGGLWVQRIELVMPGEGVLPRAGPMPGEGLLPRAIPRVGPMPGPAPVGPAPRLAPHQPDFEEEDDIPDTELDNDADSEPEPEAREEQKPAPAPESKPDPKPDPKPEPKAQPNPQPAPPVAPSPDQKKKEDEDKDPCRSGKLPPTAVTWQVGPVGQAQRVSASPLSRCPGNTIGSLARRTVYRPQFVCIAKAKKSRIWYPCHMLHGRTRRTGPRNLHGPGNQRWNIIIGDVGLNRNMYETVEKWTLFRVYDLNQVLWLDSEVTSYFPNDPCFAKEIRVTYGLWDMQANSRGPVLDSQPFTSTETPPPCGTSLPAIPSPRPAPGAPAGHGTFNSSIGICEREMQSRNFQVSGGGLKVSVRANPTGADCSISEYVVALWKANGRFWPDGEMSRTTVRVGKVGTLQWSDLPVGEYYLKFSVGAHAANCCLNGDLSVQEFAVGLSPLAKGSEGPVGERQA